MERPVGRGGCIQPASATTRMTRSISGIRRDFGPTPNDERQHITASGIVHLPLGFDVAPILTFGTARPFDLRSTTDILDRGSGYSRPVIVPNNDPHNYLAIADSTTALTCLAAGTCHQAGYDTLRGFKYFQTDLRIAKNFRMGESRNLQLIFQAFNLTDKSNTGSIIYDTAGGEEIPGARRFWQREQHVHPRAFVG